MKSPNKGINNFDWVQRIMSLQVETNTVHVSLADILYLLPAKLYEVQIVHCFTINGDSMCCTLKNEFNRMPQSDSVHFDLFFKSIYSCVLIVKQPGMMRFICEVFNRPLDTHLWPSIDQATAQICCYVQILILVMQPVLLDQCCLVIDDIISCVWFYLMYLYKHDFEKQF